MDVQTLHVRDEGKEWWVVFDTTRTLNGKAGGTRAEALTAWETKYGKPGKVTVYRGFHRKSEAAMTIAGHQTEDGGQFKE